MRKNRKKRRSGSYAQCKIYRFRSAPEILASMYGYTVAKSGVLKRFALESAGSLMSAASAPGSTEIKKALILQGFFVSTSITSSRLQGFDHSHSIVAGGLPEMS